MTRVPEENGKRDEKKESDKPLTFSDAVAIAAGVTKLVIDDKRW